VNICIHKRDLEGSSLVFPFRNNDRDPTVLGFRVGWCTVHNGLLPHEVLPLTNGERVNILAWLKATKPNPQEKAEPHPPQDVSTEGGFGLENFPVEILASICSYLPVRSVVMLCATSSVLRCKCSSDVIWRDICWKLIPNSVQSIEYGFKELFDMKFGCSIDNISLKRRKNLGILPQEHHYLTVGDSNGKNYLFHIFIEAN
jgi:hypothetical protein